MYRIFGRVPLNSLRFKLINIIIVIAVPLVLLLIYFSQYSIKVVHEQVAKSNKNLLSMYMEQMDGTLSEVDKYLATLGATNYDLINLASFARENDYAMAKVNLSNRFKTDLRLYPLIDSMFVYVPARDDYFYIFNEGSTLDERLNVKMSISERVRSDARSGARFLLDEWEVSQIQGEYYLIKVYDYGSVLLGAWVNVRRLMLPMNLINFGETGRSFYVTDEGLPMEPNGQTAAIQIDVTREDDYDYLIKENQERYLVIQNRSQVGAFSLVALVQEKSILDQLPILRNVVQLITYGSLIVLPLAFILMQRTVLYPLNRILAALKFTRDGLIEYRIENVKTSYEFQRVNEAFNQMMSQIHKLRIDVYEEQLGKQRAELKLLQLQLNPHFLLNSLNIMHSLAFMRRYELIQELCIIITQYFRYMLRSKVTFVPLEDELKHVRNYLRIQELRFQDQLSYEIECPEACRQIEVPPLIIHTFVENSIKYAVTMEEPAHVSISIRETREPEPRMNIRITDNGPGFPDDVLLTLSNGEQLQDEEEEHVGIWNVQRRLELLYEGKARIGFSNLAQGACVELSLPLA